MRLGESKAHFAIELTGAADMKDFTEFKINTPRSSEKYENITSFIVPGRHQSNPPALMRLHNSEFNLCGITIASRHDEEEFGRRLNRKLGYPYNVILRGDMGSGYPLFFDDKCNKISLTEVELASSEGIQLFYKKIHCLIAFRKAMTRDELSRWLAELSNDNLSGIQECVFGINNFYAATKETFASQLLALADQDLSEAVLDSFIRNNAAYFAKALGHQRARSQVILEIKDGDPDASSLRPDYLMERADGHYDIVDLKKALIRKTVVGPKRRLRYHSYVYELVAQLEGYRRYFQNAKNAEWAKQKNGVTIGDDVKLYGIVGNHSNFIREEVDIASTLHPSVTVLSYSELANLTRSNS